MNNGFFHDANGDKSMSRLGYFISVVGGVAATFIALYYDRNGADIIFAATAGLAAGTAINNRTQEAKENMLNNAAPVDATLDVKA